MPSWARVPWEGIVVRGPGISEAGTRRGGRTRKRNTRASVLGALGGPERQVKKKRDVIIERIRPRQRGPSTQSKVRRWEEQRRDEGD